MEEFRRLIAEETRRQITEKRGAPALTDAVAGLGVEDSLSWGRRPRSCAKCARRSARWPARSPLTSPGAVGPTVTRQFGIRETHSGLHDSSV